MTGPMSNAARIARHAEEAAAAAEERASQQAAKKEAIARVARKRRAPAAPPRLKIVWAVGKTGAGSPKIYPYLERAAADAEAARVGGGCCVTPMKVPMV